MAQLEELRKQGWSYTVGYNHDYKAYLAQAWKWRDKPERFEAPGGGWITLFRFCCSALGDSLESAASQAAHFAATDPDGRWYDRLPIIPQH